MDVAQECMWMVNRLAAGSSEFTKAEQETLALIAYKQPMKQSVVVKIRGNKAYEHVKKFVGIGLINKKRMGHTAELTLNENFFDYFNLTGDSDANNFEIVEKARKKEGEIRKEGEVKNAEGGNNSPASEGG